MGLPQKVCQKDLKVANIMDELYVEVAKRHEAKSFLLRRTQWPIYNGVDFLGLK
jgi:hypothetical protein